MNRSCSHFEMMEVNQWMEEKSLRRQQHRISTSVLRVHIVHGGRDPLVSVADKTWLRDTLNGLGLTDGIKLTLFDDGDHCCTQYVTEIRRAAAAEFLDAYTQRTAARCQPDRRLPTA